MCTYTPTSGGGGGQGGQSGGADGTGGTGAAEEEKGSCDDCHDDAARCQANASLVAAVQRSWHEKRAIERCDKPTRIGDVRARGGLRISDLAYGRSVIPGFVAADWHFSCDYFNQASGGTKVYMCVGEYRHSCKKSYAIDLPGASFGEEKNVGVDFNLGKFGGVRPSGKTSVTYQYGGKTGWESATEELLTALQGLCASAQFDCLQEYECIGDKQ
jgi:hypothetical protein